MSNETAKCKQLNNRERRPERYWFCGVVVLLFNSPANRLTYPLYIQTSAHTEGEAHGCLILFNLRASCFLFFSVVNSYYKRIHLFSGKIAFTFGFYSRTNLEVFTLISRFKCVKFIVDHLNDFFSFGFELLLRIKRVPVFYSITFHQT